MIDKVTIYEVGPRDGLQNEARFIPTDGKIELINLLSAAGLEKIEVSSFVSPKWVPQLRDAGEVFAGITKSPKITYAALVPNIKGLEAAIEAGAEEIAVFASASEGFSQKNTNGSIAEVMSRLRDVASVARDTDLPIRGYVSCIDSCPYDGPTPHDAVAKVSSDLLDIGCFEISLGDTTGKAPADRIASLLDHLVTQISAENLAGHFHDTSGAALENVRVSLEHGLRTFDAAVDGLGGCPYAPGAKGNLDTRHLVEFLEGSGFSTGVHLDGIAKAEALVADWALEAKT